MVGRTDVLTYAYRRYLAGQISLPELLRTVRQWRPVHEVGGQVVLDGEEPAP